MDKLSDMRAVSHDQANKLAAIGISTAAQLLKAGATPEGRRDLVERTGIDKDHILSFVNYSDLCRIKGISVKYANLLEAAGVDTVKELGKLTRQFTEQLVDDILLFE